MKIINRISVLFLLALLSSLSCAHAQSGTKKNQPYKGRNIFFEVGTMWVYETESWVFSRVYADTFMITGMYYDKDGKEYYVVRYPNYDTKYMYDEDGKWYFQRGVTDSFNLLIDFNAQDSFHFKTNDYCRGRFTTVYNGKASIDSVEAIQLPDMSRANLLHIRYQLKDSVAPGAISKRTAIAGIGFIHSDSTVWVGNDPFQMGLLWTTCDTNTTIRKLRCFYNKGQWMHFIDYDCDSSWFTSATIQPKQNTPLLIYPNPVIKGNTIHFISKVDHYFLYDLSGRLLLSGQNTNRIPSGDLPAGMYFLRAMRGRQNLVQKVQIE